MNIECPDCKNQLQIMIQHKYMNIYCGYMSHKDNCSKFTKNVLFKGVVLNDNDYNIVNSIEDVPNAPQLLIAALKVRILKDL